MRRRRCSSATSTLPRSSRRAATSSTARGSSTQRAKLIPELFGIDLGGGHVTGTGNPADGRPATETGSGHDRGPVARGRRDRGPDAAEPEPRRGPHPPGTTALLTTGPGAGSAGVRARRAGARLHRLSRCARAIASDTAAPPSLPLHAARQARARACRQSVPARSVERGDVDLGAVALDRAQHAVGDHLLGPCSSRRSGGSDAARVGEHARRRARSPGKIDDTPTPRRRQVLAQRRGRSRAGRTSSPSRRTCRRSPPCRRATR